MHEFRVLLFIIEKDFWLSQTVELFFRSESADTVQQYLKDTIKKEYHIKQIEIVHNK